MNDDVAPFLVILFLASVVLGLGIFVGSQIYGHDGEKGRDCFTNNTCLPGLVCIHGDGHEPGTCVTPKKEGNNGLH